MKKLAVVLMAGVSLLAGCVAYEVPNQDRGEHSRVRDQDRDGVSDRMDRDRDGDGIRNREDRRPNDPRRY
ncbi:MAG: hypothetical protein Q8M11_18920 [Sulfuritalea sp.]|nr:hypothetical protein [Sulfuritalea sp.]MDP1983405.1 hypothetical protein [Sulfuritalea sp.]